MMFEPFGEQGQRRLTEARVLICGCGALGGSVAAILARAGTGFLRLIDDDTVSLDNLHRQFLFDEADANSNAFKVVAASKALQSANGDVAIEPIGARLTAENGPQWVADVDVIVDGTDNFSTRFLLNELALRFGKPLVWGGVSGTSGQVMTVIPGQTPCLGCVLNPDLLDQTGEGKTPFPVLSPIVQVVAAFQAMEAIKLLCGKTTDVCRDLTVFDLWNNRVRHISLQHLLAERCARCRNIDGNKAVLQL